VPGQIHAAIATAKDKGFKPFRLRHGYLLSSRKPRETASSSPRPRNRILESQAEKPHEREAVAKLVFRLIVRKILERLQHQRLEDHPSSHGLRPAGLLRATSLARSPPVISDAFSFGRKDSHGIIGSDQRNPIAPSHPLPVVKFKEIL
jgi:hypothetical protein